MVTQVPSKSYAGLYIFKSVYGHYVVGPTNVTQQSKEDRGCDVENVALLKHHILAKFPCLKEAEQIGVYTGLRPQSLEYHDYQIRFSLDKSFVTCGAIRSTGLTASRAIAEYCAKTIFGAETYENMSRKEDVTMPVPKLMKDGINIQVGAFTFRPTHKLSQLGFDAQAESSLQLQSTL